MVPSIGSTIHVGASVNAYSDSNLPKQAELVGGLLAIGRLFGKDTELGCSGPAARRDNGNGNTFGKAKDTEASAASGQVLPLVGRIWSPNRQVWISPDPPASSGGCSVWLSVCLPFQLSVLHIYLRTYPTTYYPPTDLPTDLPKYLPHYLPTWICTMMYMTTKLRKRGIYIDIYIYICKYIYIYIHIFIYIYVSVCVDLYIYIYIHIHLRIC